MWFKYAGFPVRKKDIQRECKLRYSSPKFELRETYTEKQVRQQSTIGIWCEKCKTITVHNCIGRSDTLLNYYKCDDCGNLKTIKFMGE